MVSGSRPKGITILAILEALGGIYLLVSGLQEISVPAMPSSLAGYGFQSAVIRMIPNVLGTVLIIIGLVSLLLAWGMWTGKRWARMTALIFAILSIIVNLI